MNRPIIYGGDKENYIFYPVLKNRLMHVNPLTLRQSEILNLKSAIEWQPALTFFKALITFC